jgi:hypothetical protein
MKSEAVRLLISMPENDRFNGCLNEIELGFVKREATPKFISNFGVQLHLAYLSLSGIFLLLK